MTPYIACYNPISDPQMRLFCLHHAGGGASSYREWQPYFEPLGVEIVPIQLPGRENRISEPFPVNVDELIMAMIEELQPYLDRPLAIWGHSMGAVLGYELALRLRLAEIAPVKCLLASAKEAPHIKVSLSKTIGLSDPEFIESVRQYDGLPSAVLNEPEMLELVLPALRADFELCEQYQFHPSQPLDCPIYCYGGIQDKTVSHAGMMAWESLTSQSFTFRRFPGDHFYTKSQPGLLFKAIMQDLSKVLSFGGELA